MGTLPMDVAALGGNGRGISSDPLTGSAVLIGGLEVYKTTKGNSTVRKPRVWRTGLGGWERVILPSLATDGSGEVEEVSQGGTVVGTSNGHAVTWEPDGAGGWNISALPGVANTANGINRAGDLVVG